MIEHRDAPRGNVVVRDHRGFDRGVHNNAVVVRDRGWHGGGRVVVHGAPYYRGGGYRVDRRPIFIRRPIIRERYYNYYRRPALIVENYAPMDGYYWVTGAWTWNGYEWIWQPGHYQPDPNYVGAYDNGAYDNGYYDSY